MVYVALQVLLCQDIELNNVEIERLWLNRNYYDILCRMVIDRNSDIEDIDHEVEKLSERYGEIMLPEYLEGKQLGSVDIFCSKK